MPANSQLEKSSLLIGIDPDTYGIATVNGGGIAVADFRKAEVVLITRLMAANATLNVKVQFSIDDEANWSNLLGDDGSTVVAFAELTEDDDNVVRRGLLYLVELPEGTTHIRIVAVTAAAAAEHAVTVRLSEPYKAPVVKDSVAQASGGNAFYAIHGVGAR